MNTKIIYDSFNARYLTFQEVADSFIENEYFDKVIKNNHSLLMGPRGCGKTTLLKMLTPPSLSYWDKKNKTDFLNELPFFGVYVPTDIHWKKQLDQLNKDLGNEDTSLLISRATITINILLSLVKTFAFLKSIFERETESDLFEVEIKLSKLLIDSWQLGKPISPTFGTIELELLNKIAFLNVEVKKSMLDKRHSPILDKFYLFDFFDLIKMACVSFDQCFVGHENKRWAFCFDELEIAPEWLQLELLKYLRSRDQKIIFKLTTAPIVSLLRKIKSDYTLDASENHDFNTVKIWTSTQKEFKTWKRFGEKLIKSRLKRKLGRNIDPESFLGLSFIDRVLHESFSSRSFKQDIDFEPNTISWFIYKELAKIDPSFRKFLEHKKINPNNPQPISKAQVDTVFRKIKQIVIYRYQFRKEGSFRRSRKVIPLYYGIPLVYELCDGNPRLLIGMLDELTELAITTKNDLRALNINEQSKIITTISQKYLSVISSHPDANVVIKEKVINLSFLIEQIGDFFHQKMVIDNFTMDPVGSFIVDEDVNNRFLELLELGIYLGAIIFLDSEEPISTTGLLNKRLRLSYALSPYFSLLSRDFKPINLSTILNGDKKINTQPTLFK